MTKRVVAVDDSSDDLLFLQEAWKEAAKGTDTELQVFQTAQETLAYLRGGGEAALLLVDYKMRGMTGAEMVAALRRQDAKLVPAVMLSTSDQPEDMAESYKAGANAYVVKPYAMEEFVELIRCIEKFWLNANRTPN